MIIRKYLSGASAAEKVVQFQGESVFVPKSARFLTLDKNGSLQAWREQPRCDGTGSLSGLWLRTRSPKINPRERDGLKVADVDMLKCNLYWVESLLVLN